MMPPQESKSWTEYMLQKHNDLPRGKTPARAKDDVGRLEIRLHGASNLPKTRLFGNISPYLVVKIGHTSRRTSTMSGETDPVWEQVMVFGVLLPTDNSPIQAEVQVWDETSTKNELISSATIEIPRLFAAGNKSQERLQVANLLRPKSDDDGGILRYSMSFVSVERLEAHVQMLETMERFPLLPQALAVMSRVQRLVLADLPNLPSHVQGIVADLPTMRGALSLAQQEAAKLRATAVENASDSSTSAFALSLCATALKAAAGLAKSAVRMFMSWIH